MNKLINYSGNRLSKTLLATFISLSLAACGGDSGGGSDGGKTVPKPDPTNPTNPKNPTDPKPTNPKPTNPKPTDPKNPTNPKNPTDPKNPTNPKADIADVYDASKIPALPTPAPNLIQNASFEQPIKNNWRRCGKLAQVVTLADAPTGKKAARFTSYDPETEEQASCVEFDGQAIFETDFNLDPTADEYTLSFKAKSNDIENLEKSKLSIHISYDSNIKPEFFSGMKIGELPLHIHGWSTFKYTFTRADLEKLMKEYGVPVRYDNLKLTFYSEFLDKTEIYIDDVRLVNGRELLHPFKPMPADLRNSLDRVLIWDSNKRAIASMTVGGRDLYYERDAGKAFDVVGKYSDDFELLGSTYYYNPASPTDSRVLPAKGFNLWSFNLLKPEVKPFPTKFEGIPGMFYADGDGESTYATGYELSKISANKAQDRIAFSAGSMFWTPSGPVGTSAHTFVDIYDHSGKRKIGNISGTRGTFAPDGKLAVINYDRSKYDENVVFADKDGKPNLDKSFNFSAKDIAWSPDSKKLAMIAEPTLDDYDNGHDNAKNLQYTAMYIENYDKQSIEYAGMLEQGGDLLGMQWTQDGKYILYSVQIGTKKKPIYQIRWMNPENGDVGVVTHNISAYILS